LSVSETDHSRSLWVRHRSAALSRPTIRGLCRLGRLRDAHPAATRRCGAGGGHQLLL